MVDLKPTKHTSCATYSLFTNQEGICQSTPLVLVKSIVKENKVTVLYDTLLSE